MGRAARLRSISGGCAGALALFGVACGGAATEPSASAPARASASSGATGAPRPVASIAQRSQPVDASIARAAASASAEPAASAATRPTVRGMPDPTVELAPLEARPVADCTIAGSDIPFDDGCGPKAISITSDSKLAAPLVELSPRGVPVQFALSKGRTVASISLALDGFTVTGFADVSHLPFHLAREARAFDGGVRLFQDEAVTVSRVDGKKIFVRAHDDIVDVEDIEAETTCDALRFDGFDGLPKIPQIQSGDGVPNGTTLHLRATPSTVPFLALKIVDTGSIPFLMTELEHRGAETHVQFLTRRALFQGWVDSSEIVHGDIGMGVGIGVGRCGAPKVPPRRLAFTARADTDVLVAAEPGKQGPSGVRLEKGARVLAKEAHAGWAEIELQPAAVVPAPGLHFFVPWSKLEDPPPALKPDAIE